MTESPPSPAPERLTLSWVDSPIGPLALACDDAGVLRGLSFGDGLIKAMRREYPHAGLADGAAPAPLVRTLAAYFEGDREALTRATWSLEGASAGDGFRARVWRTLAEVPPGVTISYGEMARRAGEPGAAQAAGVALNRNPIPLVLACHRVVGADGALVGFGGGLERKGWLLRHEGALLI
ncbi:methylated-DNA--[protein]-cysteine S-methyltransferase [Roseibacterium beibuensis]|uniref:methylated-DNA--[protein]-cysteine S-methyltransferase n=1 Tax=[Roseibacterium] beibuensis TaxID=1193142 RepID=UPI00217DE987|nr:methylated-DNA--[protein]-cysteine S-methyltransferase [Roseibacterium beibuensis]MCS6622942.1 methylated-DNA--[protein]-cysteine S-methyltransferase [Roseibacterium beibuensis]